MSNDLAVIFDVDGVLVDSYRPHYLSWRGMFGEQGIEFTEETFRGTFGRTNRDIFLDLYQGGLTEEQIVAWGDRKEVLYREIIAAELTVIPGAVELVDALHAAGFKLGVGSSAPPENIAVTLAKLERMDKFDAVITAANVKIGKPNPQVYLLGADKLGVPPARCAVVEDAPQGVEAANRAGMASIGLTGTTTREALSHARLVVDRLDELTPERIARLIGEC
jgi:beta-phosphoglucomutase